jgi:hypothetical protein
VFLLYKEVSHQACEWQTWYLNPEWLDSKAHALNYQASVVWHHAGVSDMKTVQSPAVVKLAF